MGEPVATGPQAAESLNRLEVIADTFLSMNAPIQAALPLWLAQRGPFQLQVLDRMRSNLALLDARLRGTSTQRLSLQGGWTTVLHVPRSLHGQSFAEVAIAHNVLVQPGSFYGLPEGRAVLSLLTPPELWGRGLAQLPLD